MRNKNSTFKFNEEVTLTGTYAKSIISQRGEGEHQGHYKIIVNDTLEAILLPPYQQEALRPDEEVKKLEGKRVTVTGILKKTTTLSRPSLENQPQSVNIPCFITIKSINLAE